MDLNQFRSSIAQRMPTSPNSYRNLQKRLMQQAITNWAPPSPPLNQVLNIPQIPVSQTVPEIQNQPQRMGIMP
jgi:hypothetical protein